MRTTASVRRVQYSASVERARQQPSLCSSAMNKKSRELTSTIPRNTIDLPVVADLEKPAVARLADTVVPTVPWSANLISDFPFLLAVANCNYAANDFMTGNARKGCAVAKCALLEEGI